MGAAYSSLGRTKVLYATSLVLLGSFFLFLLLYVPCQQLWSLWDGQFTLPHFFPGQAYNSNLCTYFRL